jgi:hypothetical protein
MFFHRKNQPPEAPQPEVHVLPLLCPEHSAVLITEPRGNGEWAFYCPLCRLLAEQPVQQPLRPVTEPLKPGARLHAERAKTRMLSRLQRAKNGRLVVLPGQGEQSRGNTDALSFANLHTVGEHRCVE